MRKLKQALALLLALMLLLTTAVSEEQLAPEAMEELVAEESAQQEPVEEEPPMEEPAGEEPAIEEPTEEEPDIEESAEEVKEKEPAGDAALPAAPEVLIAPEWEYDEETGAITIPYAELPETLTFEWNFDGEAAQYAVQTAPVPEGDNPEERGERIYTTEPRIELSAVEYSEGGWFSLYVIAIMEDGTEIEGWKYFRLEQREALAADLEIMTMADSEEKYNGNDYTKDKVLAQKLSDVMNGKADILKYDGKLWAFKIGDYIDDVEYSIPNAGYSGYQCYIYANAVYYYLFGEVPFQGNLSYKKSHIALKGLKSLTYADCEEAGVTCGTYIRTTSNSDGSYNGNYGHSLIVLKYDQSTLTWLDCNSEGDLKISLHTEEWGDFNNKETTGRKRIISHALIPPVAVSSITLSPKTRTLLLGDEATNQFTLSAQIEPDNATNKSLEWTASNPGIVEIEKVSNESARIKGVNPGTTDIVCSATDGSGVSASCQVTVIDYRIDPAEITLGVGQTATISALQGEKKIKSNFATSDKTIVSEEGEESGWD